MKNHRSLGLDELMIVNPGTPGVPEPGGMDFFLGEGEILYRVEEPQAGQSLAGTAGFFLGDDGNLYHLEGLQAFLAQAESDPNLAGQSRMPRFFLGEDGTLYEIKNR
jgi:hypothetical protein